MEVLLWTSDGFIQNCDLQIDNFRAYLLEFRQLQVSGIHKPYFSVGFSQSWGSSVWSCWEEALCLFLDPEVPVPQYPPCHSTLGGDRLDLRTQAPRGSSWGSKLMYSWVPDTRATQVAPRERRLMALPGPTFFLEDRGLRL